MIRARGGRRGGDRSATSRSAATWQAHVLDTAAVEDQLDRLWAQVGLADRGSPNGAHGGEQTTSDTDSATARVGDGVEVATGGADGTPGEDIHPGGTGGGVLTRTNTLNLIVVARSVAEATRVEAAILRLTDFHPSRAIILVADPRHGSAPGLDLRLGLLEQPAQKGRPAVRFECITVEAGATAMGTLASVASPLLIAELPDFLWWPGDIPGAGAHFQDLAELSDRLIVDTATLVEPPPGLRALAALLRRTRGCPFLSDFAWARLAPWRQLVAQFFDVPDARPCLATIEDIDIVYEPRSSGDHSGFTAALLAAGWLATRLGWEAVDRLERTRTGYRLSLRAPAGNGRPARRVVIRLRPAYDPAFRHGLAAISITARGTAPGTFKVERTTTVGLTTTSETPGRPRVGRMVHAVPPSDAELLEAELHMFGRDRVYEDALTFAAALMPGGVAPSPVGFPPPPRPPGGAPR